MAVYRSSTCPSCGKDVKVCLNCRFYEPGAHWDCRETIQEPVRDKDRANFCDYFVLSRARQAKGSSKRDESARNDFNKLFGDQ